MHTPYHPLAGDPLIVKHSRRGLDLRRHVAAGLALILAAFLLVVTYRHAPFPVPLGGARHQDASIFDHVLNETLGVSRSMSRGFRPNWGSSNPVFSSRKSSW